MMSTYVIVVFRIRAFTASFFTVEDAIRFTLFCFSLALHVVVLRSTVFSILLEPFSSLLFSTVLH